MKAHKHWDERVLSDLCEVFRKKNSFYVQLIIRNKGFLVVFPTWEIFYAEALVLSAEALVLPAEALVLPAEVLVLPAEALVLPAEVLVLQRVFSCEFTCNHAYLLLP